MSRSQTWVLKANPALGSIMEYLRTHGPSTTAQMKAAGVDVTFGMISDLKHYGLIHKRPEMRRKGEEDVWSL